MEKNMYRPIYHFLPERNWMNDPNGVCWYKGEYHLFYQYNPSADTWGNLHWGHAKSKDCVHWEKLPVALYPSNEQKEIHCFSGCASVDGEKPLIYYTSVGDGERNSRTGAQQWCAYSEDDMVTWKKYEKNPIITKDIHGGLEVLEWRDPFVWKGEKGWYMVLGACVEEKGAALLYYSEDQLSWAFIRILARSERNEENIWECPNYFKLGDKAFLVVSPNGAPRYFMGREEKDCEFIPEGEGVMDHSGWDGFYAPNSFIDDKNRRIMIGWLTENSRGDLQIPGWQGVQSLPRVLGYDGGELTMTPLPELCCLRGAKEEEAALLLDGEWKAKTRGRALELLFTLDASSMSGRFELEVLACEDHRERTCIWYEKEEDRVTLYRAESNLEGVTKTNPLSFCKTHLTDGKVNFHVFVDHSVIEVFVNEREAISSRVYPSQDDSTGVYLRGEKAFITGLQIFQMNPA